MYNFCLVPSLLGATSSLCGACKLLKLLGSDIFCRGIACQFQHSVRVFFTVNPLSNSCDSKLFIDIRVMFKTSIVISGIHEPDNDLDRNLVQEDIVLRPTSAVTIEQTRSDFTSNHRIADFWFYLNFFLFAVWHTQRH